MFPLSFPSKAVLAAAVVLSAGTFVQAQSNSEYKITKVDSNLLESPTFTGVRYDKRGYKPGNWLEIEVTFDWRPKAKEPKYTEELTFNYYILLKNKSQQFPQGSLLVGSVTLTSIPQANNMHTVVYVSPRSLERFFDGKVPANGAAVVEAVGVTISKQGQLVSEFSTGNFRPQWWSQFQQVPGYVLNKSETPFGPLAWDYYEAIKPKSPGL